LCGGPHLPAPPTHVHACTSANSYATLTNTHAHALFLPLCRPHRGSLGTCQHCQPNGHTCHVPRAPHGCRAHVARCACRPSLKVTHRRVCAILLPVYVQERLCHTARTRVLYLVITGFAHVHSLLCMCTRMCIRTYIYAHMHTHTHACIYT